MFGLALIALHVGLRSAKAIRGGAAPPRAEWVGLACAALAAAANPWGFALYGVPLQPLDRDTPFRTLIEWSAFVPSLDPTSWTGRFGWMAAFASLGAARIRQPFPIALALVTGAMSLSARRFVPLFAVCAAPLVAEGLALALAFARRALPAPRSGWPRVAAGGAALLVALALWHDVRFVPHPLQRWTAREGFPTGAAAYLAAMPDPPQRLFHFYDWGGYLMLAAPRVPVFIDGRAGTVYGDPVARAYLELLEARRGWRRDLEAYGVDAVLVLPGAPLISALRSEEPPWRVAYADPRSVLLFRPDAPTATALPPVASVLRGSDLALFRGSRWRRRGRLERARAELLDARRLDPLNLYVYRELMLLAAQRGDGREVERWTREALRVYPRRWTQIWAFAETAWAGLGRCEEQLDALRRLRVDEPFVPDALRAEARARIREVEAALASGSGCAPAPHGGVARRGPG